MSSMPYSEIGLVLRTAREDRRVSLSQAARELHIRARYLNALEEGRFSDIPGVAYTKGYLQSYAAYLRLDKDEILRRFDQMEGVLARKGFYFPEVFSKEEKPNYKLAYGGIIAAIAIYIAWAIVLAPPHQEIAVVEALPAPEHKAAISAAMAENVACFRPQEGLYPACYVNRAEINDSLAPRRPLATVMQLADYW